MLIKICAFVKNNKLLELLQPGGNSWSTMKTQWQKTHDTCGPCKWQGKDRWRLRGATVKVQTQLSDVRLLGIFMGELVNNLHLHLHSCEREWIHPLLKFRAGWLILPCNESWLACSCFDRFKCNAKLGIKLSIEKFLKET